MKFDVTIKALIYDSEGRLLFAKDSEDGKWDLPGGRIETGEKIEDGIRRELQEELSAELTKVHAVKLAELIIHKDNEERFLVGVRVEVKDYNFKPSNENVENQFIAKDDFDKFEYCYEGLKALKKDLYD